MNLQNKIYSKWDIELSKTIDAITLDHNELKEQLIENKNQLACEYIQKWVDETRELIEKLLPDNLN